MPGASGGPAAHCDFPLPAAELRGPSAVDQWVPLGGTAPRVVMWVPLGGTAPVWLVGAPRGNSPPCGYVGAPWGNSPPCGYVGAPWGNSPPCGYVVAPWGTALPCEQVLQGNRPPVPHSREPSRQAPPGSCPGCRPLLSQRRARTVAPGPAGAGPGLVTRGCSHPQARGDKGGHVPKPARGRRWCGAARRVDTPPACSPREPGRVGPP